MQENVLAGGDALGLGIAGSAIAQGRRSAEVLHAKLRGLNTLKVTDPVHADVHSEQILLDSKPGCGAVSAPRLPALDRLGPGMDEVTATITEDQFLAEVERCFSCGACSGCEQCYMYCTEGCFTRVDNPRPGHYFTLNLDTCHECGKCVEVCPGDYLEIS